MQCYVTECVEAESGYLRAPVRVTGCSRMFVGSAQSILQVASILYHAVEHPHPSADTPCLTGSFSEASRPSRHERRGSGVVVRSAVSATVQSRLVELAAKSLEQ